MVARQQPPPSRPHEHVYRRRRAVATIVALAVVALLIAALSSHGDNTHTTTQSGAHVKVAIARTDAEQQALMKAAEEKAINHVLSYTQAIREGGAKGNEVALTFDDGPGPYTVQLVTELNKLGAHGTFFAIGNEERFFSAGTQLELRSGDVVGDHTESHPMLASLSAHDQYEEMFEQIARVELLGGTRPRLFRPPYGSFNATTFKTTHKLRLLMVLWSTDTSDYATPGAAAITRAALAGVHPGSIILMHDGGGDRSETIAALPAIVSGLRKKGLEPVTIPRLLLDDPPPPGQPLPHSLAGD